MSSSSSSVYRVVQESQELDRQPERQRRSRRAVSQPSPLTLFTAVFTAALSLNLLRGPPPPPAVRQTLENDPQCGLTTGGQPECHWDCTRKFLPLDVPIVADPECLTDCFPEEPCVLSLIEDYSASGGICGQEVTGYWPWPISPTPCSSVGGILTSGLCRAETETLLLDENCISNVFKMTSIVYDTIINLVRNMCKDEVYQRWYQYQRDLFVDTSSRSPGEFSKIIPSFNFLPLKNYEILRKELPYTHTRHRYPWICSLRTKGSGTEHLCAVTLLSRPPRPTVLVGPAHCTYLCKRDPTTILPACCCADGYENCVKENPSCGEEPRVYEMSGEDAEIVCGEWETGPRYSLFSGETYNVILPILEIVRHPDWDTSPGRGGPGAGNDIAVFKVDDDRLRSAKNHRIYPSCLPPEISPEITDHNGDQVKVILQLPQWSLSWL